MKKIRVYSLIRISFAVQALILILGVVISTSGVINLPWIISAINLSSILIGLGVLTGIITKYDFYKKFGGEIIDDYELVNWSNLLNNRWIVFFIIQLSFIFLNPLLIKHFALQFVEGWTQGKEHTVPLMFKMVLTLSPTIIFTLGNFIWRINKSEEELIILKRRNRIKTEDLESLIEKVNLSLWFEKDPPLKKDKNLLIELISLNHRNINLIDEELWNENDFIFQVIKINPFVILFIPNKFKEDLDVVIEYAKSFPSWGIVLETINKTYLTNTVISNYLEYQSEDQVKMNWIILSAYLETTNN